MRKCPHTLTFVTLYYCSHARSGIYDFGPRVSSQVLPRFLITCNEKTSWRRISDGAVLTSNGIFM